MRFLMKLANKVRSDIAFAANYLARHIHQPTDEFWEAGNHFPRYLEGTNRLRLIYTRGEGSVISAFSNADWAQEKPTRKLISGYLFFRAVGLVSKISKQHSVVA